MKTILTALTVLMLAACSTSNATDSTMVRSSKMPGPEQKMMKVSHEGFAAMRAVRAARIAIFNGLPTQANELLAKATTSLNIAAKDDATYVVNADAIVGDKMVKDDTVSMENDWIPIDGQIALADAFIPTTENAAYIKKANEHFKMGQSKEALEELRLGAIEVTFSRVLMPLNGTLNKVTEATRLISEHKYYEANLSLKAAEDNLVVDSVSLVEVPRTNNNRGMMDR